MRGASSLSGCRQPVEPLNRVELGLVAHPDRGADGVGQRRLVDELGSQPGGARSLGFRDEVHLALGLERVRVGVAPAPGAVDLLALADLVDQSDRALVERRVGRSRVLPVLAQERVVVETV